MQKDSINMVLSFFMPTPNSSRGEGSH